MYTLSTDTAGQEILGYTLRTPDGNAETFSNMEEVTQRIKGVDSHLCCWASLADALIDLTWRQEQWGDVGSRTISYWGGGFVRRQVVPNPNGTRLEWDDIVGRK